MPRQPAVAPWSNPRYRVPFGVTRIDIDIRSVRLGPPNSVAEAKLGAGN